MKTSCPYPYKSDTVSAVVATFLSGLVAGSLAFGSFVDVRTMNQMVAGDDNNGSNDAEKDDAKKKKKKKNIDTVANLFPYWWPNGRDWMVPLIGAASLTNFVAHYYCKQLNTSKCCNGNNNNKNNNMSWIYSGLLLFGLLPYTKLIMGEDIEKLMFTTDNTLSMEQEVTEMTISFGKKHHVRTLVSMLAFVISLVSLIHLPHPHHHDVTPATKK